MNWSDIIGAIAPYAEGQGTAAPIVSDTRVTGSGGSVGNSPYVDGRQETAQEIAGRYQAYRNVGTPALSPLVSAATGDDSYTGNGIYTGSNSNNDAIRYINGVPYTPNDPEYWGSGSDSGSGSSSDMSHNPYNSNGEYDPYNDQVTPQLEPLVGPALGDSYVAVPN